jgi:hypothetical protein
MLNSTQDSFSTADEDPKKRVKSDEESVARPLIRKEGIK